MKKMFKKVINIICLVVLVILCNHNFSYAGSIGDSPNAWWIFFALYGIPIIFIIFIFIILVCIFATPNESSLMQQKKADIRTTKRENMKKKYSIGEVIYASINILIMYFMFFYRDFLLILNMIIALSIVLIGGFLYYIYIDKKQEKFEQYGTTRKISKEKVEKSITKLRNKVYLNNFLITFLGIVSNVGPIILVLLFLLMLVSIVILTVSSKKISTAIGFATLIISISIVSNCLFSILKV